MNPAARVRTPSRTALLRACRIILGAFLLTTCSTDTVGPRGVVVGVLDAGGLFRAAAEFALPIDEVLVEVRRVSDNSLAFSRTLSSDEFNSNSDEIRIRISLNLNSASEQFSFTATARSAGVSYYQASGTITATAFETVETGPIVPSYIGPGANADFVGIPSVTTLGNGQSVTLTATVLEDDVEITGVPVSYQSSDSSLVIPQQQGLSSAQITAPATGSGSVTITAKIPTGVSGSGSVVWSPQAAALVLVSGDGQTVPTNTAAAAPLVVQVQDGQGGPVAGTQVTFAVDAGPTGTSVAPTTAVSDLQGNAQTILTAGSTGGAITVSAAATGLNGSPVLFSATAVTSIGIPAVVVANSPVNQTATVNTAVLAPPSVIVRDASGNAVPSVDVTFAITQGNGSLTGATQTTNSSGVATLTSWTVGQLTGPNSVSATVGSLTPVVFNATGTAGSATSMTLISGDNQTGATATALALPLVVEVRDQFTNLVPNATVTWTPTDGSAAPPSGPTGTDGRAQTIWTMGAGQLTPTLVAAVTGAGSVTFHATTTFPAPTILLSTGGLNLVGVGLSRTVNVTLSQPAPVGGLTINLSSDNTNVLTVAVPSINIAELATTGSFNINGVSAGTTFVRASGAGYTDGALSITSTLQIISLPATQNVPFGQNQNIPVSLALAAPAGGVTVSIASSDATRVAVVTNTVNIPQGSQVGTAVVFGQLPGPSTITATAPGFVTATSAATTTAVLNIVQASATLNQSFGTTVTIELRSGATTVPAPAGGLVVNLQSGNTNCLSVPATVTIPQGLVNTTAPLTYGGVATTPCSTTFAVSAPNITSDQINVTVNQVPSINLNLPGQFTGRLGNGLQDIASGNLQVATPVATTVHLSSGDPTVLLLAPDATTPGTPTVDIPVAANNTSFSYYTQGVGVSAGPVKIFVSSTSYANDSTTVTIAAPGFDILSLPTILTSLAATDPFTVRIGVPNTNNTGLQALQALRAGSSPVTATVNNSNTAVAKLVTSTDTADQVTVQIGLGVTGSPSTVAAGGVGFDPRAAGTTTVSATLPGFTAMPAATVNVTINAPNINLNTPAQFTGRVGNGLQDFGSGSLQNATPVATTIRITSRDPASLLIAPNLTTPGADFADIPIAAGASSFSYVVQGVGVSAAPVRIVASSTGYNADSTTITVANPGVDILSLPTALTSFATTDPFTTRIGVVNSNGTALQALQQIRAGGSPVTVTLTSSDLAVGRLVTLPDTGSPVTVTIPLGATSSPSTVAAGGVAFDPIGGGTTTVNATIPGFTSVNSATVNVTVSAPNINLNTPAQFTGRLGNGLQDNASGGLQTASPLATTVRVSSGDPSSLLIAPNSTTPGTPFIDIPIAAGGASFSYFVQGVGVSTGPVTITAQSTGYNDGTTSIVVAQPALAIGGLATAVTTFSTTDPFLVQVGVPNAGNTNFSASQAVRAGGTDLTATIDNSNGTFAQLVTTATTGNRVTVTIPVGASVSPSTVALGGVAFDPLVAGTTTVSATIPGFVALPTATVNVTISAPTITLNTPGQFTGFVAAGLQDGTNGGFQVVTPGPLTVRVQSSNLNVALVSPNATTPGTEFIDIPVGAGAGSFNYFIQGVEGATGTVQISATAPGYSTGVVNAQIVQPAMQISGLNTTYPSTAANDPFQVLIGSPNAGRTSMAAFQAVRAGGTPFTITLQNTNGNAATLVTTGAPGGSNQVTVVVGVGQNGSPTTRAAGGVEFDPLAAGSTNVSATDPILFALPQASVNVTVQ